MKKFVVLAVLPLILFGLETVNLIKDHSFEKDSEVWLTRTYATSTPSIAVVDRNDSEKAFTGQNSGSGDTRPRPSSPSPLYSENALINQGFSIGKVLDDIDSIFLRYSILPYDDDFSLSGFIFIFLHLNSHSEDFLKVGYAIKASDLGANPSPPLYI